LRALSLFGNVRDTHPLFDVAAAYELGAALAGSAIEELSLVDLLLWDVPGAGAALCRRLEAHSTLTDLCLACNPFPAMDAPDDAPVLAAGAVMRLLCHAGAALRKLALCCSHFGDDGFRGVARARASWLHAAHAPGRHVQQLVERLLAGRAAAGGDGVRLHACARGG
jgi:hypothetical protein